MGAVVRLEDTRRRKNGEVKQFIKKKEVKLTKLGEIKKTPNNTQCNRDNVKPIKEYDIPKIIKYLSDYRDSSSNKEDYQIRFRNLTMFIIGINIALRVSDLISLKWSDVYNDNWEFNSGKKITPKKTSKYKKHILLAYNDAFKRAITEYREYVKPKNLNSYIFTTRQNPNGHIKDGSVEEFIKKAASNVEIMYDINTHSMRKTFARVRYDHSTDKSKTLVELMVVYGHASINATKHYICITEEEIEALYNEINLGYDEITI